MKIASAIVLAGFAVIFGKHASAATSCEDLRKLSIANAEITGATLVAAGAFTPPAVAPLQMGGTPPPTTAGPAPAAAPGPNAQQARQQAVYKTLPAFCRVTATLRPSADSDIKIEVWLPAKAWNGRIETVGNGGFQARIGYNNLAAGLKDGYVITNTDTGHAGDNGDSMIGHPEKVIDWGYRAVHEDVVAAKAITAAFYGKKANYSYYAGCSTGGRQGWVGAEYYPNDFDGLAIGDPANPMSRLQAGSIWSNLVYNATDAGRLTRDDWFLVRNTVMQQCDAKDGLKDGLIANPLACNFDPQTIACKAGQTNNCLTPAKIDVLTKLTKGATNSAGEQVYPGWPAGTLVGPGGPLLSAKAQDDAVDTFKVLYQNAKWDYHTLNLDKDVPLTDKLGKYLMNGDDPSRLAPLFARGGKIILYHGWYDPAITPLISIKLYQDAVAANGGLAKTYNDMRLFMVPAMGHCQGGEGPAAFDKLAALTAWVEKGQAPSQIVASHADNTGKVDRTRPLCPYPKIAKYKGSGSIDEAKNFSCAAP